MKKNVKRFIAMIALAAIVMLIVMFALSAFTAAPGEAENRFFTLLFCIIAIPILAWILLFCIGRMQHKHTKAKPFPEQEEEHQPPSGLI